MWNDKAKKDSGVWDALALVPVAHQYELAKLPFIESYSLLVNPYRTWGVQSRPFPEKMEWVTYYEKGKYDLAILHVDQQSIFNPELGDVIHKGKLYGQIKEVIGDDIPIVTINHMTPFHDKYEPAYVVDAIKKLVKGTYMIVNSNEARKQWGFGNTVIHGMDVNEWWDLPKEPIAITVLSQAGMEKAYRRIFLHTVKRYLDEMGVPFVWVGVDRKMNNFDEYRDFIGRALVYFNPTWQSPRPRARTEAMLSGACVVTTPYHDADTYIKDGENGFLTSKMQIADPRIMDNPRYTADLIKRLVVDEPEKARQIGQKGKKTAQDLFNKASFTKQWEKVIKEVGIW